MISTKQITLIHVAKARTGMTEDEYRAMLSGFGVESSKKLSQAKFERVMEHFEKMGFKWFRGKPAASRDLLRGKVRKLLSGLGLTDSYADAIAKNSHGVDSWCWLKDEELRLLVAKLTYHQRRHPERRHG